MTDATKHKNVLTEAEVDASPWYQWLKRRFGDVVAARIVRETANYTHDVLDRNLENYTAAIDSELERPNDDGA